MSQMFLMSVLLFETCALHGVPVTVENICGQDPFTHDCQANDDGLLYLCHTLILAEYTLRQCDSGIPDDMIRGYHNYTTTCHCFARFMNIHRTFMRIPSYTRLMYSRFVWSRFHG